MKLTQLCLLMLVVSLAFAGNPKKYGKPITLKEPTKISAILDNPKSFDGKKVLVEGMVVDVCQHRGCWITVSSDRKSEDIRFKVEDGVIVFPKDAKGKKARAEGVVSVKTASVEEQIEQGKHHAEEQGGTFDPATVKGPKTVVQIMGEGAIIK